MTFGSAAAVSAVMLVGFPEIVGREHAVKRVGYASA